MPLKIGDRVRENTSSTGVGGLSLTGAPAGFQRFSEVLSSGDTTYYSLEENDKFEVGIGTYGSNNLERTTVLSSSNSGNKINLGGSGIVFITYPASKAIFNNETGQLVLGPSGLKFHDGNSLVGPKLVELIDVSLSGTPVHSSVFNLNITAKSLTIGDRVGNSNTANVLLGYGAGSGITTGSSNIIIGAEAATKTTTGFRNVHIGQLSGPNLNGSDVSAHQSVSIGYRAGDKMRHDAVAIGNLAAVNTYKEGFVAIGSSAGSGIGVYGVGVGYKALEDYSDGYSVGIGYEAGKSGGGQDGVWVGNSAGKSSSGATRSIGIGKNAGKSSTATDSIYIGHNAGDSNSSNDHIYIGNGTPTSNGTLIKGNMSTGRIAVGSADVSLSDTFYVGVSSSSENGIVVKGAVSQSADLTQWKNSSDVVLASVSNSGVVTGNAISASGNGLKLASVTPVSTSNTLYNINSILHWNGLAVGTPSGVPSGVAFFGDDSSIAQDQNIKYDSTNQRLQLGDGGIKFKDGTTQTTADNDTYVSGVAAYASGAINGGDIAVGQFIYHHGETNTYLQFNPDKITAFAGGKEMLKIIEQAQDQVIINDDGETINLVAKGNNDSSLLKTDPTNDRVAIGAASPEYKLDVAGHDALIRSSGLIVGNSGIVLASNAPAVTTNTLYNEGGTLKFNGSAVGDVTTAQLNYVSGIAVYSSGQTIANQSSITALNTASGIATSLLAVSGTATSLVASSGIASYASGQAISNQSNITSLLTASGTATSLIASSGIANYASGQAVSNQANIATNASNITYVSGVATNKFTVTASDSNNYTFNGMGLSNGLDPDLYLHKGHTYYFDKQTASHPFRVSATDGGSVYQDAAGNSIEISGQGVLKFEVPQNAPDKLYYYCTSHASNMKGEIYTTNNVDEIIHVSGIAAYASGQAISNQGNITALLSASGTATSLIASSGIATYASGQAIENEGIATYASGQAVENESDILAVSGIAAFSSGVVTDVDVIIGQVSTTAGTGIAIGYGAGLDSSIDKANAANGYKASDVLIGHFAGSGYIHHAPTSTALSSEQQNVMIGFKAGANSLNYRGGSTALGDNVYIGVEAGHTASGYHRVCIGDEAAHSSSGIRVVAIGAKCFEHSEGDDNTAVGYRAGGYSTGDHNLYLGTLAGFGVIGANNIELLTEGPNPSLIGGNSNKIHIENTIIGDTSAKKIAIGNIAAGDLTPDATLEVKPKVASDIGVIVQGVASHSANLQEWQNNSEEVLARVEPNGVIFSSGVTASGLLLPNHVPVSTTNTLYNEGGTLKFNGSAVGGGDVSTAQLNYVSGIAVYSSGQAVANESDLVGVSGIAAYASGVSLIVKEADGSPNVSNVRTIVVTNGTLTDDGGGQVTIATSGGGGGGGGSSLTAGSGITIDGADKINVYGGSGHFINLNVEGAFSATTKSFLIDHPTKEGMKLQYGSLEGPENGVYLRGTSGSNIITLPEYWSTLVDQSTVTVSLTPVGYYQALYIAEKGKNYIKVGGAKGSYDYVIYGERKDVEKLKVEW